jgi:hypothetical protein
VSGPVLEPQAPDACCACCAPGAANRPVAVLSRGADAVRGAALRLAELGYPEADCAEALAVAGGGEDAALVALYAQFTGTGRRVALCCVTRVR